MPSWLEGSEATFAPIPKLPVRLFSFPNEEAILQILNSSDASIPGPVFQIASFSMPSNGTALISTRRRPSGANRAASSAFIISSRIIIAFGQRSMRLAMRKSSSATSSAVTALVVMLAPLEFEPTTALAARGFKTSLDSSDRIFKRANDLSDLGILEFIDLSIRQISNSRNRLDRFVRARFRKGAKLLAFGGGPCTHPGFFD